MKLEEIRKDIDKVDSQIADLFKERMALSLDIAKAKQEGNLPVVNASREKEILHTGDWSMQGYVNYPGGMIYQYKVPQLISDKQVLLHLGECIEKALEETPKLFPKKAVVACQGVEGSYSQAACEKLFEVPSTMYFNSFEGVFNAVEKGLCQYGILPIENSSYGSTVPS